MLTETTRVSENHPAMFKTPKWSTAKFIYLILSEVNPIINKE